MWLSKAIIHLRVDDALRAAAFYEALLDSPPTRRSAQSAVFDLDSPPLVLTILERPLARRSKPPSGVPVGQPGFSEEGDSVRAGGAFEMPPAPRVGVRRALVLREPKQIGDVAIRLRRTGARLWIEDQGIEAHDPDGNAWRVRCVPAAQGRAVVTDPEDSRRGRRR
jgi:catechol 2,3-dioxygenase-like lactoylglutathione lyase family enzyme